ncbi:hypothetical protein CDO73_01280 [Saccharibacillus sp. O23]|uniref:hypothetical protein n=1 Tax=Saccharibacillus sp. O23 TaxID=2009338 RepID=UPI000B4E4ABB|nr:hypothetical protein [Saccharibacillus sp. O23]OWR33165.1 hypothetical protein CDO73_01280 [Saccharibacillus sp. O23]
MEGKAEFLDKKLKRRYVWTQAGLSTVLLVPLLLCLYLLPERTALPAALGIVALVYLGHSLVDYKYVRGTREHVVSGIMAAIHAAIALGLYLVG